MTVIVDDLARYPSGVWCHMAVEGGDDLEELHKFAQSIGLKRSWFQDTPRLPHYDLRASKRRLAVAAGAVEVDPKSMTRKMLRPSKREMQRGT